jgi:hypothetical protein
MVIAGTGHLAKVGTMVIMAKVGTMVIMAKIGTVIMGKRSEQPPVIIVGKGWNHRHGQKVGTTTGYGMQANLGKGRSRERSRTTSYGTKAILGIKVWSPGSGLFYVLSMAVAVAWSWETSVAMASLI